MSNKVKVWDVPTRLFHWTLLAMFIGMWLSAENGQLQIHTKLGVAMLVLVVFRVLWGFVGSQTARFSDFFKPCQVKPTCVAKSAKTSSRATTRWVA